MMNNELKDRNGRPIGKLSTTLDGKQELKSSAGKPLGKYNPKTNQTHDASGRLVGNGNLLAALITDK